MSPRVTRIKRLMVVMAALFEQGDRAFAQGNPADARKAYERANRIHMLVTKKVGGLYGRAKG